MMKYPCDIDEARDDATGGYNKYNLLFIEYTEDELRKKQYEGIPHLVHHVDMDAILSGREKRLTINQSMNRGALLCKEFVEEVKQRQSDKQTDELGKDKIYNGFERI